MKSTFSLAVLAATALQASNFLAAAQSLPVVDVLTTRHQAISNTTGDYFTFRNIPYAEAPLGALRFRPSVPRLTVNRTIDDGSNARICPQASGPWFAQSIPLVLGTIAGTCNNTSGNPPGPPPPTNIPESEDCLLLDVTVPRTVWEGRATTKRPVLVWIHGGGYIEGSKEVASVANLMAKSVANNKGGMVFVSMNYRLGLFGFPPRQPGIWDVASNAGIYDQRLALEWIRIHISKFGGDRDHITVIGESAGAGSIMTHLSAFGGIDGTSPFKRAILQSPAMKPAVDAARYAQVYQDFLAAAGVSSYAEARALTTEQLQGVNDAMVADAAFADTVFSPNVDGLYIPELPARSLAQGKVDKAVSVIVAHTSDEGLLFTNPGVQDDAGFKNFFQSFMPNVPATKINTLASQVYPPNFSGSQPYTTQTERLKLAIGEALIDCNAFGLHTAFGNATRGYLFDVCPGLHAQDVPYAFFNGETSDFLGLLINAGVAGTLQDWIVDFTLLGAESGSSVTQLPLYGSTGQVLQVPTFSSVQDPARNQRCHFWLNDLTA